MITDVRTDQLGQSLSLGYLANGVVQALAVVAAGQTPRSSDLEALQLALRFLEQASQGPAVLAKSRLGGRSVEAAIAFDTATQAAAHSSLRDTTSGQLATRGDDVVTAFLHRLLEICDRVIRGETATADELTALRRFFSAIGQISLERASELVLRHEDDLTWPTSPGHQSLV